MVVEEETLPLEKVMALVVAVAVVSMPLVV